MTDGHTAFEILLTLRRNNKFLKSISYHNVHRTLKLIKFELSEASDDLF